MISFFHTIIGSKINLFLHFYLFSEFKINFWSRQYHQLAANINVLKNSSLPFNNAHQTLEGHGLAGEAILSLTLIGIRYAPRGNIAGNCLSNPNEARVVSAGLPPTGYIPSEIATGNFLTILYYFLSTRRRNDSKLNTRVNLSFLNSV